MLTEDRLYLYRQAVKQWGIVPQYLQLTEEMAELTVMVHHLIRGRIRDPKHDEGLAEEIADVEICLEQFRDILGNYLAVEKARDLKLKRLEERLAKGGASNE